MQIYKTFLTYTNKVKDGAPTADLVSWQASQTEASKARTAARARGYKAESQTVNVPTAKGPLLAWLNENVTQ